MRQGFQGKVKEYFLDFIKNYQLLYSISKASNVSRYSIISAVFIREKRAFSASSSSGLYRTGQSVSSWNRHQGP